MSTHYSSGAAAQMFQGLSKNRVSIIAPAQRARIIELMMHYDRTQKELATMPLNHPGRPGLVAQFKMCTTELARNESELSRLYIQLQQQQQTQQQQISPVNMAPAMTSAGQVQTAMTSAGQVQTAMPPRSNLVMSQQRKQQIQQLIKETPQYSAAHNQPLSAPVSFISVIFSENFTVILGKIMSSCADLKYLGSKTCVFGNLPFKSCDLFVISGVVPP